MAYRQAGMRHPLREIDFAEVDDTYAYKELQALEALGLFGPGEAGELTEAGFTTPDGDLPVNVSGGSLGMGHLLDATGLARVLEAVLQLRGDAGPRQLEDVEVGVVQSWRGVPTTSGAVAILSNREGREPWV
jgi:acetyl-CoA C-acetyltransferase